MRLRVDLPTHWLGPVFLGAAWTVGLVVTDRRRPGRRRVRTRHADAWAAAGRRRSPVLACSLLPLGVRFADPRPAGVHDVGLEVWSQPDALRAVGPADRPRRRHRRRLDASGRRAGRPPPGVSSPTAAVSSRWPTRLPHRESPPSPSRSYAAARWSSSDTLTRIVSTRRTPRNGPPHRAVTAGRPVSRPGRRPPSRSPR